MSQENVDKLVLEMLKITGVEHSDGSNNGFNKLEELIKSNSYIKTMLRCLETNSDFDQK